MEGRCFHSQHAKIYTRNSGRSDKNISKAPFKRPISGYNMSHNIFSE